MDRSGIGGDVRGDLYMVGEDACVLEELGSSTCHEVTSHGVGVGLVAGAEEQAQTLALAIGEV